MPFRKNWTLSDKDIEKIIDLRKNEKLKLSAIGERYSRSTQTIAKILHDNGVPAGKRGKREDWNEKIIPRMKIRM